MKKLLVFCLIVGLLGCKKENIGVNPLLIGTWEQNIVSNGTNYTREVSFGKDGSSDGFFVCCESYNKFKQENSTIIFTPETICYPIVACQFGGGYRYDIVLLTSTELVLDNDGFLYKFKRKM